MCFKRKNGRKRVKDMMEMYKITYDEILIARLEIHIKDMWSTDKSSVSIYGNVNDLLISLKNTEVITSYEYEKLVEYNKLQKDIISDLRIIEKIKNNTKMEELCSMYNHIETETGRNHFFNKVGEIIKS